MAAFPPVNNCLDYISALGSCSKCQDNYELEINLPLDQPASFSCKSTNITVCQLEEYIDSQSKCQNCGFGCSTCQSNTGLCENCKQGFLIQNYSKDCKIQEGSLKLASVNFDSLKTTIRAKFDSEIKLKDSNKIVVLMTLKGSSVIVKIVSVRSSRQEMILELDFKQTEELKNKEIEVKGEKIMILIENMV